MHIELIGNSNKEKIFNNFLENIDNEIKRVNFVYKHEIYNLEKKIKNINENCIKKNNIITTIINQYYSNISFLKNIIYKTPLNYNIKKQGLETKLFKNQEKILLNKKNIEIYEKDIYLNSEILKELKNDFEQNSLKREFDYNNLIIKDFLKIEKLKNKLIYIK